MKLRIELTQDDLKRLVYTELESRLGDFPLKPEHIKIETRSKQNYKSEWETAEYRAVYEL
jgi:hypothetical protein